MIYLEKSKAAILVVPVKLWALVVGIAAHSWLRKAVKKLFNDFLLLIRSLNQPYNVHVQITVEK